HPDQHKLRFGAFTAPSNPPPHVGGYVQLVGVQRFFDRCDHLALDGERGAGDASAGGGGVAATAELGGDVVDIDLVALGAEADAGQRGFELLEDAGDDDGRDGADMIYQAFGFAALSAGTGEVGFLEPEVSDLVAMREAEVAV